MMPRDAYQAFDEQFLADVFAEVRRARAKYPQPNPQVAAIAEEAGELAQAMLHVREGKSTHWDDVYVEAVQLAAMALRCASEGDETLGVVPTARNCR